MQKITLQFLSLSDLALFSKTLKSGYFMNTGKLTLTGNFASPDIEVAVKTFNATEIMTTDKVYTYN